MENEAIVIRDFKQSELTKNLPVIWSHGIDTEEIKSSIVDNLEFTVKNLGENIWTERDRLEQIWQSTIELEQE